MRQIAIWRPLIMATSLIRRDRIPFLKACRFLHSVALCENRSLLQSSGPLSQPPRRATLPSAQPLMPVGGPGRLVSFPAKRPSCFLNLNPRTFCAVPSATVNRDNPAASEDSTGGQKSGDSPRTSGDAGKPVRGGPVSWLSFLLLLVTGAGVLVYFDRLKKRHIEEINNASKAVKEGPSVGQAAIGGPFSLVNHDGKRVTEQDFLGKWTLIYFGFTHCPDICPDELQKLAAAVDELKKKGIGIVPVFISVDPERDTVDQVREYVKEFHPDLIGLTGSPDEIKKVARAYRVYYMKTAEEDSDYLVDHSIVMYLMDPKMNFVKFFGKNNDVNSLANGILREIMSRK